jgi:hypothetical protein
VPLVTRHPAALRLVLAQPSANADSNQGKWQPSRWTNSVATKTVALSQVDVVSICARRPFSCRLPGLLSSVRSFFRLPLLTPPWWIEKEFDSCAVLRPGVNNNPFNIIHVDGSGTHLSDAGLQRFVPAI